MGESFAAAGRWWIQLPPQKAFFTITMSKSIPFSLPVLESQSSSSTGSDSDGHRQVPQQSIILPPNSTIAAVADALEKNAHNWPITPQLPTDLSVQIQDATFTVHKLPLVSKCGYIAHLELQPSISNFGYEVKLENFPGGSETFEAVLRFCYGLPLDLNPQNIVPLRCASEYLEMSEDLEDGNLITKTEAFLTFVILSSWKDTITVLQSCETLSPWAENLQIVRRCCDSITWKASRENDAASDQDSAWWLDDVATLHINHFARIITAIRAKGTKPEIVGKCIMQYASKWLSGVDEELKELRGYVGQGKGELQFSVLSGRKKEDEYVGHKEQQTTIIENLISLLPPQQEAVPCRFLLQMLNMATVYSASPALITQLEKRVGIILDKATVNDLLIPNYTTTDQGKLLKSPDQSTMHDIDTVQRIVEYFLMHEQDQQQMQSIPGKASVSKLLDNYLAEIAKDPNVSVTKFHVLAEALPESSRTCHDGLYRAIDIYLKTHPSLSEHDRKRVCRLMNCEKLSLDACMHAAQNDRLPVRTVIQVLFTEQVKLRAAMQRKDTPESGNISEQEVVHQTETKSEIMTLKAELENVKTRMAELQKDYLELQHEYAKLNNKHKHTLAWGWKKIRTSTLFHRKADEIEIEEGRQRSNSTSQKVKSGKVNGVEIEEGRQRSNSTSQKLNSRRRMSV